MRCINVCSQVNIIINRLAIVYLIDCVNCSHPHFSDLRLLIYTRLVSILTQIWSTFALHKANIANVATNIINLPDDSFSILVYARGSVWHPQCDHFSESGRFKEMT